jgi:hypothetical protein
MRQQEQLTSGWYFHTRTHCEPRWLAYYLYDLTMMLTDNVVGVLDCYERSVSEVVRLDI